jgi:hypothetical protein
MLYCAHITVAGHRALPNNRLAFNALAAHQSHHWTVEESSPGFVKMTRKSESVYGGDKAIAVVVYKSRVRKVYKLLSSENIRNVLAPASCRCKRQCDIKFTTA